ncbi:MAG TPA: glycosyltransferase family 2 protein [Chitinophagaceae bacterium]|nr:glycosyltransferase family 2 protein [Chitinophagaceae bacterium]
MIPCLMITYNRLEYTKRALAAALESDFDKVIVIDNGSTDDTVDWLQRQDHPKLFVKFHNGESSTIASAMNRFLYITQRCHVVGKVDNDTIIPNNFVNRMISGLQVADIVQAKHPILKATHPDGFDAWVKTMPSQGCVRFNHFVGGSGILFKRDIIDEVPETDWALGGWREFQRRKPLLKKAFVTDVEIQLLDTDENGADYSKYPEYYTETRRL